MRGAASEPLLETLRASARLLRCLMVLIAAVYLASGVFIVRENEVAFVLRFGKIYGQMRKPGIHFALPYPVDEILKVPVKTGLMLELKDLWHPIPDAAEVEQEGRSLGSSSSSSPQAPGPKPRDADYGDSIDPTVEGYCITGDQNIVQPSLVVKYTVSDPEKYLFRNAGAVDCMEAVVYAELVKALAARDIDAILLEDRRKIADEVKGRSQERLDELDSGLTIDRVEFDRDITPPRQVIRAFRAYQDAYIWYDKLIHEADKYRLRELQYAQGAASTILADAREYRELTTRAAMGDAKSFRDLVEVYRGRPELVRERVWREAVESILSNVGARYFVPPGGESHLRLLLPRPEEPPQKPGRTEEKK